MTDLVVLALGFGVGIVLGFIILGIFSLLNRWRKSKTGPVEPIVRASSREGRIALHPGTIEPIRSWLAGLDLEGEYASGYLYESLRDLRGKGFRGSNREIRYLVSRLIEAGIFERKRNRRFRVSQQWQSRLSTLWASATSDTPTKKSEQQK